MTSITQLLSAEAIRRSQSTLGDDVQMDSAFFIFSQLPSDEEKEESYLKNVREAMLVGS